MTDRLRIGVDLDHEHDGRRWIYKISTTYERAIFAAGGLPVWISPGDPRPVDEIVESVDGFLLSGGDDFHPALLGRAGDDLPMTLLSVRRERFLLGLGQALLAGGKPTLGVCLGAQTLNLVAGGSFHLDLPSEHPDAVEHRGGHEHRVIPEPGGLLYRYWGGQSLTLQSHHHQAVDCLGTGLQVEARAEDGVVEAFRAESHPFLLGLQWHPEANIDSPGGLPLIRSLVEASRTMS